MPGGLFITLEGGDGCGKSTQASLLTAALEAQGREVVRFREPGGAAISEKVRAILLDPANAEMVPECELLLFEAGRAQNVRQIVEPALERGAVVLADRFYDSSTAYQLAARGLAPEVVEAANALGSCGRVPDLTFVLDVDPAVGAARRAAERDDRIEEEGLAFQQRVREGYLALAAREPERIKVIDASGSPDEVFARILVILSEAIAGGGSVAEGSPAAPKAQEAPTL